MAVTAKEIAQKLGISTASVSVALNGKPGVSRATREKVLAAAKELGYRVLIRYYHAGQDFDAQLRDIWDDLAGLLVLGTDFTAARRGEILSLLTCAGSPLPVVVVDSFVLSAYVDCVGNDNLYGAKSAVSYLIDQGHRRLCYLRARQRIANFDDREHGVRMAVSEHLPHAPDALTVLDVDITAERAYRELLEAIDPARLPDAFFAENDVVAAAAIRALTAKGISVPGDVSVMGFDDIPICEMVEPTLTTVHAFKETLGAEAVGLLHRRIQRGQSVQDAQAAGLIKLSLSTRIVERQSVSRS